MRSLAITTISISKSNDLKQENIYVANPVRVSNPFWV
jgi:hypothetical protein